MGFGGRDYFARQHEQQRVEWDKEQAWHRGWQAGYQQGTRDMRRAYERNEVGEPRAETKEPGLANEGLPQNVEPTLNIETCDDPECPEEHVKIVIASGPYSGPDWGC